MKDGSDFNPEGGYEGFWQNRDDRFYASVAYPGSPYGFEYLIPDKVIWNHFIVNEQGVFTSYDHGYQTNFSINPTGFYRKKALDTTLVMGAYDLCELDWIEMRLAEVMMNHAEAANEAGHPDDALDMLYQIRERAGIEEGTGNFGITETSKAGIRERIKKERFVELAFEDKRWDDLRRWRMFDYLNEIEVRHGLFCIIEDINESPSGNANVDDWADKFIYEVVKVEDKEEGTKFNLQEHHYFFGIPLTHMERNPNLEQTQGYDNGTFDPLQ